MLLRSGIIVALFTLLSRLFGLAREFFIASVFGTSQIGDCVNVALRLPNLFRRIVAEGALSAVFIPIYSEKLAMSATEARNFSSKVLILLVLTLVMLTIAIEIFMPNIIFLIAPGFYQEQGKLQLVILLCRITMPYLIFISITALLGGMLNAANRFGPFAFVPVILNLSIIIITYLLHHRYPDHLSIAMAVIIAGLSQVLFMMFFICRAGLKMTYSFDLHDPEVWKMIKNMGPAALSAGSQQLNLFISQSIASFIPGAISILAYADRLYQLPLALIGITFGTILLPELSRMYKKKHYERINILQNTAIQLALLISIPATCGLFVLSHPIIHLIYERGEFTAHDTQLTAQVLSCFALGMPAFILAKIIIPIYYANLDTKTPLLTTVYSMVINSVLNVVLMLYCSYIGIAISTAVGAWINVYLLASKAQKYGTLHITQQTKILILKILFSAICMSLYIYIISYFWGNMFYDIQIITKLVSILATITSAIIIFLIILRFLGIRIQHFNPAVYKTNIKALIV